MTTLLWVWLAIAFVFAVFLWHVRRVVTRDAREANQFLRDMGAPTGLKVKRPDA